MLKMHEEFLDTAFDVILQNTKGIEVLRKLKGKNW